MIKQLLYSQLVATGVSIATDGVVPVLNDFVTVDENTLKFPKQN